MASFFFACITCIVALQFGFTQKLGIELDECGELSTYEYIHQGSVRKYAIFLPNVYCDMNKISLPILMLFHGFTELPNVHFLRWGWSEFIEKYGFITILPFGGGDQRDLSWNAGACWYAILYFFVVFQTKSLICSSGQNRDQNIDDVGFVFNLLMDLFATLDIDINNREKFNLFVAGHSNGAFMSSQIAWSNISDIIPITATVLISGYVYDNTELLANRVNRDAMNMMIVHGIDDGVVNLNGCGCQNIHCCCGIDDSNVCLNVKDEFFEWTEWNHCQQSGVVNDLEEFEKNESTDLCFYAAPNGLSCKSLNALCLIDNAGHQMWNIPETDRLKNEIWTFFLRSICLKQGGQWNKNDNLCDCTNDADFYCTQNRVSTPRPTRRIKLKFVPMNEPHTNFSNYEP